MVDSPTVVDKHVVAGNRAKFFFSDVEGKAFVLLVLQLLYVTQVNCTDSTDV